MIRLGEKQVLRVMKEVEFGLYLSETEHSEFVSEPVLLPIKQKPDGMKPGDSIEVFLYRDSQDRPIATVREPAVTLGKVARLRVVQVGAIGAFLDWGLEKDLLMPFKEQTRKVQEGDYCNVALYIDKSDRLCATMKIYHYLDKESPYHKDDMVTGELYEISSRFGAFVAVDHRYSGLIPAREMHGDMKVGDLITARVAAVKEDGKLDLSIRRKAYLQMETDSTAVMEKLDRHDGVLPYTDHASPELIRREMDMSKNEFKRAIGRLLKEKKIEINGNEIRKLKK